MRRMTSAMVRPDVQAMQSVLSACDAAHGGSRRARQPRLTNVERVEGAPMGGRGGDDQQTGGLRAATLLPGEGEDVPVALCDVRIHVEGKESGSHRRQPGSPSVARCVVASEGDAGVQLAEGHDGDGRRRWKLDVRGGSQHDAGVQQDSGHRSVAVDDRLLQRVQLVGERLVRRQREHPSQGNLIDIHPRAPGGARRHDPCYGSAANRHGKALPPFGGTKDGGDVVAKLALGYHSL